MADQAELTGHRRHLHAHPELGREEHATTAYVVDRLASYGLDPTPLRGTGVVCDLGDGDGPLVLLRADLDALPLADLTGAPYASTVDGVAHACGHDAHTAMLLGAAQDLTAIWRSQGLPGRVRLLFQPAEELMPGGALDCLEQGVLDGVTSAYALHCDPSLARGRVGVRTGPLTSAADWVEVRLSGPGGHTSRPHLTVDLVQALGAVATQVPALLARRTDPRAGVLLVWGALHSGDAPNAIPSTGVLRGTVRVLDAETWHLLPAIVEELVRAVAATHGAEVELTYRPGVPPVVNAPGPADVLAAVARPVAEVVPTGQSLGGEDFAWFAQRLPAAMARLGVGRPGWSGPVVDLHQGGFDLDEAALPIGAAVLTGAALAAMSAPGG